MAEQAGKERLNNNEFRELIPHLPIADLLRIEYRKDKWFKLITISDPVKKLFGCTLCSITNSNVKNLTSHMEGKKHKVNIQDVKQLYHPEYTYTKQEWKLAVGAVNTAVGAKAPTQKTKNNEESAADTEDNQTQPGNKINKNETPTTPHREIVNENVGNSKKGEDSSSAVLKTKTPIAKPMLKTNPTLQVASPKSVTATVTQAAKASTNITKPGLKFVIPKIAVEGAVKKAPITSSKSLVKPKVVAESTSKPQVSNTNATMNQAAKSITNSATKPNQLKQQTRKDMQVATKQLSKPKNESTVSKTPNNNTVNPKTTGPSAFSTISNKPKETSDAIKIGPNASDPSWNPKVSVKNLNVSKIAKTSASNSSQAGTKNQTPSSTRPAKIPLKKIPTTEKRVVKDAESDKATQSGLVEKDTKGSPSAQIKSKGTSLKGPQVQSVFAVDNSSTQVASNNTQLDQTQVAESTEATRDQSEFSEDVQFNEMCVKFDDNLNIPNTNLVKNPFSLKQDGSKNRAAKISCVPSEKLKKPENLNTKLQISEEIIVIDDDLPVTEQDTEDNALQNSSVVVTPLPKAQRQKVRQTEKQENSQQSIKIQEKPTKRSSGSVEEADNENSLKKQKIVLNPAAAFLTEAASTKQNESNVEPPTSGKPNYQTNRIIIPTVHKAKRDEAPINDPKLNFSIKTFSSKPKDDEIHGLLGVEYVVKIMKTREDISPRYECTLCELNLDGPSMQNHLVGYNHRLKFCEKHFPTAIRQYRQYLGKVPTYETFKVLTPILAKLAVAIEQHHGRDLPYEVLEQEYNLNRHDILSKVFSCRHASEQYGPAFTHVLDVKEIDVLIAQKDHFKPQVGPARQIFTIRPGTLPRRERKRIRNDINPKPAPVSIRPHPYLGSSQYRHPGPSDYNTGYVPPVDDETHKQMVAAFLRGTHQSGSPAARHHDNRERERRPRRSRSRERVRRRSRSRSNQRQQRNVRKSISPLRNGDIWQAYRHLVDQKVRDLNDVFKLYRNDPETHPMYNDEWQKFWKRRKDELISAGLDHRSYNYQPEWVRFFKVRIEELYSQALENIKIQSRERLCLPMTNSNLTDPKYHVQARNAYPGTPATEAENEERLPTDIVNQRAENPNVIAVLRLLTALEEHLGSLGPKIIDLMSKALFVEKSQPHQINDIVLTVDNCTLLQTAMEKLKGLLFAGLLEGTKERAFKKVIADTELLLSFAEVERKKKPIRALPQTLSVTNKPMYGAMAPAPVPAPVASNTTMQLSSGHDTVQTHQQTNVKGPPLAQADKKELAAKLAATLTAQGKTDFNPDQLEQLIAVYTLIEKKKREAATATMSTSGTEAEPSFQPTSTSMSSRKTLSDTLVDFMNPTNPNSSTTATIINTPDNSIAKQSYTAATINRYLEVMRRMGGSFANSGVGSNANEIWQNLQNIQRGMGANTNVNQSHSTKNTFDYVGGSSSFNNSKQFGINSISTKDTMSVGSNLQSSYRVNSMMGNQNMIGSSMGGNQPQSLLSYQKINPYVTTISQNLCDDYNAGGTFGNTNNSSRVNSNNIGINLNQANQPNRLTQSFQGNNPNQNWVTNAPGNLGGSNKRRMPCGGGGEGGPRQTTSGTGSGKNQIWRNN